MSREQATFVLLVIALFMAATTLGDIRQGDRLDQLERSVARLEQQRDRDLEQIIQLNRKVFDLPVITCTNCAPTDQP